MSNTHLHRDELSYFVLIGRQLFAVIFMLASAGHFTPAKIALAAAHGVPMATVLVPISGVIALLGGLSVLFGYRARLGGCLLIVFLVPVTLFMHNFWAAPDAATFRLQLFQFARNLVLLVCACQIARVGAGSLSLDAMMERRATVQADGLA
ncbi:MAG TPA: DoxX family protein [Vicinamibacterales bacterium]|nr:DoxX family protein [Vicinamibacterales bacterium]